MRVAVVDGREVAKNCLGRCRAQEGDGTVASKNVAPGGVPTAKTAVDGRVLVGGEVIVRTVDTVGKVGISGLVIVVPPRSYRTKDVTATGGLSAAQVRAVVALRPVVSARRGRVADVQAVDRDVLFADDDLVGGTVDDAGERVARIRMRGAFVRAVDLGAAEETSLVGLAVVREDLSYADVVVRVTVAAAVGATETGGSS